MPFIVTTKRPGECTCAMTESSQSGCEVHGYDCAEDGTIVDERVAVATLEEAIDSVKDWLWANTHPAALTLSDVEAMTESGGTVGPLPDGTLIEVRPIERAELIDALGLPAGHVAYGDTAAIIAAFNAREAGEVA